MSHVADMKFVPTELSMLIAAAAKCGLRFDPNARTYNWYGQHVGDYPLPAGFSASEMGKCDVGVFYIDGAERMGGRHAPYEIGVCKRRDGQEGFTLLWDFYAGGHGLMEKVGLDGVKLAAAYNEAVVLDQARLDGLNLVEETLLDDGTRELRLRASA